MRGLTCTIDFDGMDRGIDCAVRRFIFLIDWSIFVNADSNWVVVTLVDRGFICLNGDGGTQCLGWY